MRLEALRSVPPLPIDEPEQFHATWIAPACLKAHDTPVAMPPYRYRLRCLREVRDIDVTKR